METNLGGPIETKGIKLVAKATFIRIDSDELSLHLSKGKVECATVTMFSAHL